MELLAVSCDLNFWIYKLRVHFYDLESKFTSCKFILRFRNKITSCKLLLASCKFKETILRVAARVVSCAEDLKILFYELSVAFYKLRV